MYLSYKNTARINRIAEVNELLSLQQQTAHRITAVGRDREISSSLTLEYNRGRQIQNIPLLTMNVIKIHIRHLLPKKVIQ